MTTIEEKAKKIKLLAFDVDGVMTDGGILYTEDGKEIIYANNGEAVLKDGMLTVPAASASFIKIK